MQPVFDFYLSADLPIDCLLRAQTKKLHWRLFFLIHQALKLCAFNALSVASKNNEACKLQACSFLLIENPSSWHPLTIMIF